MPKATKEDAKKILYNNISFFVTPLNEPQLFQHVYQRCESINLIKDYSDNLKALLYKKQKKVSEHASTPVVYSWNKCHFTPALEHDDICHYIVNNKNHPALKLWQKERPLLWSSECEDDEYVPVIVQNA